LDLGYFVGILAATHSLRSSPRARVTGPLIAGRAALQALLSLLESWDGVKRE